MLRRDAYIPSDQIRYIPLQKGKLLMLATQQHAGDAWMLHGRAGISMAHLH
jgi:hypothetical protein